MVNAERSKAVGIGVTLGSDVSPHVHATTTRKKRGDRHRCTCSRTAILISCLRRWINITCEYVLKVFDVDCVSVEMLHYLVLMLHFRFSEQREKIESCFDIQDAW